MLPTKIKQKLQDIKATCLQQIKNNEETIIFYGTSRGIIIVHDYGIKRGCELYYQSQTNSIEKTITEIDNFMTYQGED